MTHWRWRLRRGPKRPPQGVERRDQIQIDVNKEQQISIEDRLTNCCTKTSIPPRILRLGLLAMGKAQKKTGKGRLDKYYKLAK